MSPECFLKKKKKITKKGLFQSAKIAEKIAFSLPFPMGPSTLKDVNWGLNTPRVTPLGPLECPQGVLSKKKKNIMKKGFFEVQKLLKILPFFCLFQWG